MAELFSHFLPLGFLLSIEWICVYEGRLYVNRLVFQMFNFKSGKEGEEMGGFDRPEYSCFLGYR